MTLRLVSVPVVISLGVILVRLFGELTEASDVWFNRWVMGPGVPDAARVVMVEWLALPFGGYFARRLMERGEGPRSPMRAAWIALAALLFLYAAPWLVPGGFDWWFRHGRHVDRTIILSALVALGWSWPGLLRTMAAYALPVALILVTVAYFAIGAGWGTHYDFQSNRPGHLSTWTRLAVVGDVVYGVPMTMLAGLIAGSLTALAWRRSHVAPSPALP